MRGRGGGRVEALYEIAGVPEKVANDLLSYRNFICSIDKIVRQA